MCGHQKRAYEDQKGANGDPRPFDKLTSNIVMLFETLFLVHTVDLEEEIRSRWMISQQPDTINQELEAGVPGWRVRSNTYKRGKMRETRKDRFPRFTIWVEIFSFLFTTYWRCDR